jgi:adenylylsulfate kinase-like enzyme/SAM-dependent methyltransferase
MQLDRFPGAVLWISGYSAAGKTTVGRNVTRALLDAGHPAIFLDGDQLRSILAHKWGYSHEERIELACTYFRLCSHLSKQGVVVVIAAVAMLEEARQWFHENVANGLEFYLRVPLEERMRRDSRTKGVYRDGMASMQGYTEPAGSAIVIDNFGTVDPDNAALRVVDAFQRQLGGTGVDYGRSEHWDSFYAGLKAQPPSPFAIACAPRFEEGSRLLELGCGSGRDAVYFAQQGLQVTALDRSNGAIEACLANHAGKGVEFLCLDAAEVGTLAPRRFDVVYSRFSLHAMTREEENSALADSHALLAAGGLLCIECRSINDRLAREGEVISPTERIAGHYRRFIVLPELTERIESLGMEIVEQIESQGLAVHADEDPVVIRVLARKR